MSEDVVQSRYIYCALHDDTRHKGKRGAYLVEQLTGSNLVARIYPIGYVKEATAEFEVKIYATKNNLVVAEHWSVTDSRNHKKARVIKGKDYKTP
jgi:hypothetical protein